MLKGIPKLLSPELLKVLCEMGHSDRIVIGDGNFPAETMGKDCTCVIRYDGADAVCTIDDNGLMCIRSEDGSGVSWLVRVEEESPAGEAADTE